MEWTETYPKKKGFYWAFLSSEAVTLVKRTGKSSIWSFGGDKISPKNIVKWGEELLMPSDCWMKTEPAEEGWYAVTYDDKTKSMVRVARGDKLHCYDFEIPSEMDLRKIDLWNGPLQAPPRPAK